MLVRSESRTHDLPRHSPVHSQVSNRCDLPRHSPVHNQVSNRRAVLRGFTGLLSRMWYSLSGKPRRSSIPSGNISVTSYLVSGSASQELYPNLKASVTHHPPQLTIPSERWTSSHYTSSLKQGRLLVCSHVIFHKSETYFKEIQHFLPVTSKTNQVNYNRFELLQNLNMGIGNLSCMTNVFSRVGSFSRTSRSLTSPAAIPSIPSSRQRSITSPILSVNLEVTTNPSSQEARELSLIIFLISRAS